MQDMYDLSTTENMAHIKPLIQDGRQCKFCDMALELDLLIFHKNLEYQKGS